MATKIKARAAKKVARSDLTGDSSLLTDMATNELRDRILDLTLAPSERLDEKMLLKRFAFGRTPIREALNRLIAEGLVESKNNRGAYVAAMSLEQTLELLEAYVLSERVLALDRQFRRCNACSGSEGYSEGIRGRCRPL